MNDEKMKSMQAYAAAFGQPEAGEQQARKPQVGDSVIIRPGAVVNSFGVQVAREAGTPCTIVEYEADDDGEDAVWNLPYYVEAPNGEHEWLRASEFDVVAVEAVPEMDTGVYVHEETRRDKLAREYEDYRAACRYAKSAIPGFTDWLELRVIALEEERDALQAQIDRMAAVMRDTAMWMKAMGMRSLLPEGGSKLYYALNKELPDDMDIAGDPQ